MALVLKINKEAWEKLPAPLKSEYKAEGDEYQLDLVGYEDPVALKSARDRERDAAKELRAKIKETQALHDALVEERDGLLKGSIPKGDVEKLETSYKTKLAKREQELSTEIATLTGTMQMMLVDNVALALASEISTAPQVILPHIKARLKAEKVGDKYETRVLGADGAPSASTLADLKKEFVLNKDFAPIITGSKGSGGGTGGGKGGGGAGSGKIDFSNPKAFAEGLRASGKAPAVS